jgi:hypothetical protein
MTRIAKTEQNQLEGGYQQHNSKSQLFKFFMDTKQKQIVFELVTRGGCLSDLNRLQQDSIEPQDFLHLT